VHDVHRRVAYSTYGARAQPRVIREYTDLELYWKDALGAHIILPQWLRFSGILDGLDSWMQAAECQTVSHWHRAASCPVVSDNPGRPLYIYPFWLIVDCAIPDRIDTIPHSRHSSNFGEKMLVHDVAITGVSQLNFVTLSYSKVSSYNCMCTTYGLQPFIAKVFPQTL